MYHSSKPEVIRLFTNFTPSALDEHHIREGLARSVGDVDLYFNKSGKADLAVVLNFARSPQFVWGRNLQIYKWLMEPEIRGSLLHRFTVSHSRLFDRVFCHNARPGVHREQLTPPMIPPHVSIREVDALIRRKRRLVSAIGSKETFLPLHRTRTKLIDALEKKNDPKVDVFGKGRTYIDSKNDGLDEYMYSVAIENSISPNYWTEKISDCLMCLTVPIYYGCDQIEKYFPEISLIKMKDYDLKNDLEDLMDSLSERDYRERIPALLEARGLLETKFNFGYQLGELLSARPQRMRSTRLTRVWDFNTLIHFAANAALKLYRILKLPLNPRQSVSK